MIFVVLAMASASVSFDPYSTLPVLPSATAHAFALTTGGPSIFSAGSFGGCA